MPLFANTLNRTLTVSLIALGLGAFSLSAQGMFRTKIPQDDHDQREFTRRTVSHPDLSSQTTGFCAREAAELQETMASVRQKKLIPPKIVLEKVINLAQSISTSTGLTPTDSANTLRPKRTWFKEKLANINERLKDDDLPENHHLDKLYKRVLQGICHHFWQEGPSPDLPPTFSASLSGFVGKTTWTQSAASFAPRFLVSRQSIEPTHEDVQGRLFLAVHPRDVDILDQHLTLLIEACSFLNESGFLPSNQTTASYLTKFFLSFSTNNRISTDKVLRAWGISFLQEQRNIYTSALLPTMLPPISSPAKALHRTDSGFFSIGSAQEDTPPTPSGNLNISGFATETMDENTDPDLNDFVNIEGYWEMSASTEDLVFVLNDEGGSLPKQQVVIPHSSIEASTRLVSSYPPTTHTLQSETHGSDEEDNDETSLRGDEWEQDLDLGAPGIVEFFINNNHPDSYQKHPTLSSIQEEEEAQERGESSSPFEMIPHPLHSPVKDSFLEETLDHPHIPQPEINLRSFSVNGDAGTDDEGENPDTEPFVSIQFQQGVLQEETHGSDNLLPRRFLSPIMIEPTHATSPQPFLTLVSPPSSSPTAQEEMNPEEPEEDFEVLLPPSLLGGSEADQKSLLTQPLQTLPIAQQLSVAPPLSLTLQPGAPRRTEKDDDDEDLQRAEWEMDFDLNQLELKEDRKFQAGSASFSPPQAFSASRSGLQTSQGSTFLTLEIPEKSPEEEQQGYSSPVLAVMSTTENRDEPSDTLGEEFLLVVESPSTPSLAPGNFFVINRTEFHSLIDLANMNLPNGHRSSNILEEDIVPQDVWLPIETPHEREQSSSLPLLGGGAYVLLSRSSSLPQEDLTAISPERLLEIPDPLPQDEPLPVGTAQEEAREVPLSQPHEEDPSLERTPAQNGNTTPVVDSLTIAPQTVLLDAVPEARVYSHAQQDSTRTLDVPPSSQDEVLPSASTRNDSAREDQQEPVSFSSSSPQTMIPISSGFIPGFTHHQKMNTFSLLSPLSLNQERPAPFAQISSSEKINSVASLSTLGGVLAFMGASPTHPSVVPSASQHFSLGIHGTPKMSLHESHPTPSGIGPQRMALEPDENPEMPPHTPNTQKTPLYLDKKQTKRRFPMKTRRFLKKVPS